MSRFTTPVKITAIKRELNFRRMVYKKRVANGSMTKSDADFQIAVFEDILEDYNEQERKEQLPL